MFCLRFLERQEPISRTEIVIGDFRERMETSLEYWSAERYEEQWLAALREIVSGTNKSALLTSVVDPITANFFFWWPLYRVGDSVFVHNQLLMLDDLRGEFSFERMGEFVPERETVDEDGNKISEWQTSVEDLETFLREAKSPG